MAVRQKHNNEAAHIIIFISDGEPTSGIKDWVSIRRNAKNANAEQYAIFTFAIGSSAPYADLERKLGQTFQLLYVKIKDHY